MQILEASITALEIAKLATSGLPIPGLSIVLESALDVAKKAKDIEDTRDDCRTLAERAATLVLAVYQQLKNVSGDTGAKGYVTALLHDLLAIDNLIQRRLRAGRRERILFALKHGKIAREVKMLTTKLEDTFRTFMIQAALDIDHNLNTLANGTIHMLHHLDDSARVADIIIEETRQIRTDLSDLAHRGVGGGAIFDGNFRLFGRENLALLEPIIDSEGSHHAATEHEDMHTVVRFQPQSGRVFRYRALVRGAGELSGMQVVVYGYPNSHDQRFVEDIKYAKQACHPFLLAVLGYSRPGDPGEVAYIVTEDYIPCISHLESLRGTSKLRALLKMKAEICMAVDHLETVGLRERLPTYELWDVTTHSHAFGSDEFVYDHRDGGRTKWTQAPLTSDWTNVIRKILDVPVMPTTRMRTAEDLRAAECAPADIMLRCWLMQILRPVGLYYVVVPGRLWWPHWGSIMDHPRYPLGVWLGRDSCYEEWTSLSARIPKSEIAAKVQIVPQILPDFRQDEDSRTFKQRLRMARWFDIPKFDSKEMCVEFTLGSGRAKTRWRRYQFSCLPVNQTLSIRQYVQIVDGPDTASEIMRLLPDASEAGHYQGIGIAVERVYHTETSVTMATHAAELYPLPLWFFMLHLNGGDDTHDCDVPCGFWSLEKYPSSIPVDIVFDTMPRCEPIQAGSEAPLFTWTQVLGDLVCNIQTKMHTMILQLSEDELSAFRALKEKRPSTGETDAHGSGDWVTADVATYDDSHGDNAGYSNSQDAMDVAENDSAEDITPQERTRLRMECSF